MIGAIVYQLTRNLTEDEIKKGGGSVHCLTAFLKRDDIPVYEVEEE